MMAPGPMVVLLSVGIHPARGRRGGSGPDRAALELALRHATSPVIGLHAGAEDEPALADYLQMGLPQIEVVHSRSDADPVAAIVAALRRLSPALVLCGAKGCLGRGSGELPFRVAAALGLPVLAGVRSFVPHGDRWHVKTVAGLGRERTLAVPAGTVLLADEHIAPRYGSLAARRSGRISTLDVGALQGIPDRAWTRRPASRHPVPLDPVMGATAVDRLERILGRTGSSQRKGVRDLTPDEAADLILSTLRDRHLGPFSAPIGGDTQ